jgi:protein subunit release factor B
MIDFGVSDKKTRALEERMAACGIKESDLEEQFIKSQGPGGQHVNKNATCVAIKHLPTGIHIKVQEGRSQVMNRYYARKRLCEHLEAKQLGEESPQAKRIAKLRKQKQRRKRRTKNRDQGSGAGDQDV